MHTIASNAGVEGAVVVSKLLEQDNPDLGYDAAKGVKINLFVLYPRNPIFSMLIICELIMVLYKQARMLIWSKLELSTH